MRRSHAPSGSRRERCADTSRTPTPSSASTLGRLRSLGFATHRASSRGRSSPLAGRVPLLDLPLPPAVLSADDRVRTLPHRLAADSAGPCRQRVFGPILLPPTRVVRRDVLGVPLAPPSDRFGTAAPAIQAVAQLGVRPKGARFAPPLARAAPTFVSCTIFASVFLADS